nr:hypothetical protein [Cyclobacteriaceae bacterium]
MKNLANKTDSSAYQVKTRTTVCRFSILYMLLIILNSCNTDEPAATEAFNPNKIDTDYTYSLAIK